MLKRGIHFQPIYQRMLKTILIPILVIALSLMLLLPVIAVILLQQSTQHQANQLQRALQSEIVKLEELVDELTHDAQIHEYLITGNKQTDIYHRLYQASNASAYHPYFYLCDTALTKDVFYQPPASASIENYLHLINIRKMINRPNQMVQLFSFTNIHLTSPALLLGCAIEQNGNTLGYLIFNFYPNQLDDILFNYKNNIVLLLNAQSRVLYSNNPMFQTVHRLEIKSSQSFLQIEDTTYLMQATVLEGSEITAVTLSSLDVIPQIIKAIFVALLVSILIAIAVFVVYSRQFTRTTFNTLDDIFFSLEQFSINNQLIPVTSRDENMNSYVNQYNHILQEIQHLIEKNHQLVLDTTTAQIKQLQSQFNPHFMFNTLASIQFMIRKDPETATDMIHQLSTMLRYSLRFMENSVVSLEDDLEYIKDYLALQKLRFEDYLDYRITVEEKGCFIPKLILQPVIENSIQHGFMGDVPFFIDIHIYSIEETLILKVRDNGSGMSEEKLKEVRHHLEHSNESSNHIGLVNCHRRLQLLYGEAYGVTIESHLQQGTTICLRCKLRKDTS